PGPQGLFLVGPSGTGKTHFLEALGQAAPTPQETPETVVRILQHCRSHIAYDPDGPVSAAAALRAKRGSSLGRARAMLAICRAARLPARLVTGFLLDAEGETSPHHWVEACVDRQWVPYDVLGGYAGALPPHYIPVRRDGDTIVWDAGAALAFSRFRIEEIESPPGAIAPSSRRPIHILEFARLSPGAQRTLGLILLLPVGALVTALFRNVVGFPTFGTLSPALLALAFVNSDLRTGLVVAGVLIFGGLAARRWIDRLHLLLVPRLSVILTLIVLGMALSISALDFYGLTPTARAALLPMVILTMTVERFHVTWDEDGFREALRVLAGSAVVAAACFAVIQWDSLAWLFLRFPECEFLVAALLILVGRYTGYRISELWRFRGLALVRREEPPQ
ncbi:MAG TPA: 7TM domain-containing protein, partial [Candidatus Brocadiia bacterium]|nr:7TM domain-containing protein [Candidatus Brocadiia bacterium]